MQATLVSELPLMFSSDQVADPVTADAKVVDPAAYPYYGQIELASGRPLRSVLDARSLVASADLLEALQVHIGDSIRINQTEFQIRDVITAEPDLFVIPPVPIGRVIVSRNAFDRTSLMQFGAVGLHRVLVKLSSDEDRHSVCAHLEEIFPGARVLDYTSRTPESVTVVTWVIPFLNLVGVLALAFGAVAVATAAYFHLLQGTQTIAILKCVGAESGRVLDLYLFQILSIALIGIFGGLVAAPLIEWAAQKIAIGFIGVPVHAAGRMSASWEAVLSGLGVTAVAAWFPLSRIRRISPLVLLRRDAGERSGPTSTTLTAALMTVLALLAYIAAGGKRGSILAGVAVALAVVFFSTDLAIVTLHRVVRSQGLRLPWTIRHGIANLHRYRRQSRPAITVLATGVAFIVLAFVGQHRLRNSILETIPFHTPNLLVLRVDKTRLTQLSTALAHQSGVEVSQFVPAAFLGLIRAGGSTLEELRKSSPDLWIQRDWPASCAGTKPSGVEVVSGRWWDQGTSEPQMALAQDLATTFGVTLGTRMNFDVRNRQISARITALIRIAPAQRAWWREMILNCQDLPDARYSGAITVAPTHLAEVRRFLGEHFPDLLVLYIDDLLVRTERIGNDMLRAIAVVGGIAVLMTVFVLLAVLRAMRAFRVKEIALLRALGAPRVKLLGSVAVEYLALGGLGGLYGALLGFAVLSALLRMGTGISEWFIEPSAIGIAVAASAGFAAAVAILGCSPLLRSKPLELLRRP